MANKKRISPAERRHQDYLRRNGLKVGKVYESRLLKLRYKEVNRLLSLCKEHGSIDQWAGVIDTYCDEQYLWDWYKGLYVDAGLPRAKSTARDLSRGKATPNEGYWEDELRRYADMQAGEKIVLVQGTFKEQLVGVVRDQMALDTQMPIEKLAREVFNGYRDIALWQARRIAQTETMISLAGAGDIAARSLDVRFSKQWAVSGLGNTRDSHLEMDGVIVYDADEPFVLPSGEMMMYPHDSSLGASAGEIINCACDCIRRPEPITYRSEANEVNVGLNGREKEINEYLSEIPTDKDEKTRTALAENIYDLKEALGIEKDKPMSYEQANEGNENPYYWQGGGYKINCQTCTITHQLRRLGFDVEAKPNIDGSAFKAVAWKDRFLNPDGSSVKYDFTFEWMRRKQITKMTDKRLNEYMREKLVSDGLYEVYCGWKSGNAHVFMAEVRSGKVKFFDPQSGSSDVSSYISQIDKRMFAILRIDDKIINPKVASLVIKA